MTIHTSKLALVSAVALCAGLGSVQAQDSITVALQLEPPHLDPTSAAAQAIDSVVYINIFEGLTRFMNDGSIVPALAKSWEISNDGLIYTFHPERWCYIPRWHRYGRGRCQVQP